MSDAMDQLLSDVGAGEIQDATQSTTPSSPASAPAQQNRSEEFDASEYENEDDETFDPTSVPIENRKVWPKKYVNALNRHVQSNTKLKSENLALQERVKQFEANGGVAPATNGQQPAANNGAAPNAAGANPKYSKEQQSKLDAAIAKKPDLEKYSQEGKDFGTYNEDLMNWKLEVALTQRDLDGELKQVAQKNEVEIEENTNRIASQAKALIEANPEYLEILVANQDYLENMKEHAANALSKTKHPELAFLVLAETPGALDALMDMDATNAALYIGEAHQIGMTKYGSKVGAAAQGNDGGNGSNPTTAKPKQISNAPAPMGKAKSAPSGQRSLSDMNGAEIMKELGL